MHHIVKIATAGKRPIHVAVIDTLEIGRECDGIIVMDERVSRRHLQLRLEGGRILAKDLGSSNGTTLDGERVTAAVVLRHGSRIGIGSTEIALFASPRDASVVATTEASRGTVIGSDSSLRPISSGSDEARRTSIEDVATAVAEDVARLSSSFDDAETVTILFSDIESSTELAVSMGDAEWMLALRAHNHIFESRVAEHGGTIIKNQGDGYMVTFTSARRGVLCASAIQHDLHRSAEQNPAHAMRVRMGLHTGEAIRDAGDLFGRHVIIAARIANLAEGAQVLVSSIVRDITNSRGDLVYSAPMAVSLKGVDGEHSLYDVDWSATQKP